MRQQVAAGRSNREIITWLVARYGNFVRLRPPFEASTPLLWGSPVLALAVGAGRGGDCPRPPPRAAPAAQRGRAGAAEGAAGLVTLLALLLLAVVALAPLAWRCGAPGAARSRRESALALHRAQLAELDRDLAENRLAPAEHAAATLEVQRRLLAAAEAPDPAPPRAARVPLLAALVLVPLLRGRALCDRRAALPARRAACRAGRAEAREAEAMIALLRERLATLDQHSETARQGYVLLGNAENGLGHLAEAAAAWRRARGDSLRPGAGDPGGGGANPD